MIADLADADELATGNRHQAVFGALLTWIEQAGNSVGGLISGFFLVWIGFGALFALLLLRRYKLTEDRAYEARDALALPPRVRQRQQRSCRHLSLS